MFAFEIELEVNKLLNHINLIILTHFYTQVTPVTPSDGGAQLSTLKG